MEEIVLSGFQLPLQNLGFPREVEETRFHVACAEGQIVKISETNTDKEIRPQGNYFSGPT